MTETRETVGLIAESIDGALRERDERIEELEDELDDLREERDAVATEQRNVEERLCHLLDLLGLSEREAEREGVFGMTRSRFEHWAAERRLVG